MDLQQQVVSLPLAKKLKELGVKQESLFWWVDGRLILQNLSYFNLDAPKSYFEGDRYPAYSVAELGEILPAGVQCNKVGPLSNNPSQKQWGWHCWQVDKNHSEDADTEADARAKMLIYLIENQLIAPTGEA